MKGHHEWTHKLTLVMMSFIFKVSGSTGSFSEKNQIKKKGKGNKYNQNYIKRERDWLNKISIKLNTVSLAFLNLKTLGIRFTIISRLLKFEGDEH